MKRSSRAVVAAAVVVLAVFAAWQAWPQSHRDRACPAPAHASGLRVWHASCVEGRVVAGACRRFTEGAAGTCAAAGRRWRCTSNRNGGGPESPESCRSARFRVDLTWGD